MLIGDLHVAAADWLAEHGHAVDAIRHAQAAGDWERAGRVLADHGLSLSLNGQVATIGALLRPSPPMRCRIPSWLRSSPSSS